VRSKVGAGSTFTLRLPVSKTPDVVVGPAPTPGPCARARVLIVDDEPEVRSALRDLLVRDGHSVVACTDGESALEAFDGDQFDVVITDLGMAGLSGWDVARLIKERSPRTPVAMVTGWSDRIDADEAERHGVEHVLAKPFRRDDLRRVLTAATVSSSGAEPAASA
jgi:CheY-like chemotaxis protein